MYTLDHLVMVLQWATVYLLGKAPTPKGALLPQRIVSYKYLSVQLHS